MGRNRGSTSSQLLNRKRRLQDYFEKPAHIVTPNNRSLPKYKPSHPLPKKKTKRPSQPNLPPRHPFHAHPHPLHQRSVNREYDSPSKDHQDIDFIIKGAHKKVKGNSIVEQVISQVNEHLKANKLREAIAVLGQGLDNEPHNQDLVYLLGICHIFNGAYPEATAIFEDMVRGKTKKNIYLLLSVCYKKADRLRDTELILEECIRHFPKYYEAYIYRGKLYLKMKHLRQALKDFDRAIAIDQHKQIAFVGKGDCLRLMENYEEARRFYSQAYRHSPNANGSLLLRRAICSMQLRHFDSALEDISGLLQGDPENSEALYFKGLMLNKMKRQSEALICYQQAIKFNTNKRAVTRAIYEITKIKIENRDYYEALFTLERAQYLDIDEKVIKKFKVFINGVTAMMKKNYQEGIKILNELEEDKEKPLSNFLKPLFYSTRSYGNMAMERYQQAREDLQAMENQFSLDLPNLYNKFVCEGIIACNNNKYENALTLFSKASKTLPYRIQPAFYKAVTLICFATKVLPKELKDKKKEYLESAMRTISKVENIENNASLYMISGLLHYALGDFDRALKDLDQCLSESTKPSPLVFYLVGLIFAESGRFNQALSEFKRAIDHDDKHTLPEAYLSRARCLVLTGEVNTGFIDLQSYMSFRPSSPQIHIWAGHLLFYIGAYEDAAKAYSNINNMNKNFQVLLYRARCYLTCKDVLNALSSLKMMLEIRTDSKTMFDYEMLECLRECSDESMQEYGGVLGQIEDAKRAHGVEHGILFQEHDYEFYRGVMNFYDKQYQAASNCFNIALDLVEREAAANPDEQFGYEFRRLSFNNRPFNYYEIVYAIAVSQIMQGQLPKALKLLKGVLDVMPQGEIRQEFTRFVALLQTETRDPFSSGAAQSVQEAEFVPFPVDNRLCSIFPEVVLPFKTPVRTRIFFCLPHVARPDIVPRFEQKILEEFSMASIEIKPEAPWIRRSEQGVIFTDEVVKYDIQLSQSSSSSSSDSQQGEEEGEHDGELFEENDGHYGHHHQLSDGFHEQEEEEGPATNQRMNAEQLRQFFKLDNQTQERLARRYN